MKATFAIITALFIQILPSFSQSQLPALAGTWALTLPNNGFNDAGWMEIKQENGYIYASVLWYGGSVTPVDHAYIYDNGMILTETRNRKTSESKELGVTTWYSVNVENDKLSGIRVEPKVDGSGVNQIEFTGVRLPADPPRPDLSKIKYGQPVKLLDSNSLQGWKIIGTVSNDLPSLETI
jgi:hypothetical protein